MIVNRQVLDLSQLVPQPVGKVPFDLIVAKEGRALLGRDDGSFGLRLGILEEDDRITSSGSVEFPFNGAFADGLIYEGYIFWSSDINGVQVMRPTSRGGPFLRAAVGGRGTAFDHDLKFPYLYLAKSRKRPFDIVEAYDLRQQPPELSWAYRDRQRDAFAIEAHGNYVFVGFSDSLGIFDITNPQAGTLLERLEDYPTLSLARWGDSLYAASTRNRLITFDISSPRMPRVTSIQQLPFVALNLKIQEGRLFAAAGPERLLVFELSDPSTPQLLSKFESRWPVLDAAFRDQTAFVAAGEGGMLVVDFSDLTEPRLVRRWQIPNYLLGYEPLAQSVAENGDIVYVGTSISRSALFGLDVRNLLWPRVISLRRFGLEVLTAGIGTMSGQGNTLFAGGGSSGLGAVPNFFLEDVTAPQNIILYQWPDPSRLDLVPRPPGPLFRTPEAMAEAATEAAAESVLDRYQVGLEWSCQECLRDRE